MSINVVPSSARDLTVLRERWAERDPDGFRDAHGDPFAALRSLGVSYGHAAHPSTAGYSYRAWVRPAGFGSPLQASGPSLLVAVLTLLLRLLVKERVS